MTATHPSTKQSNNIAAQAHLIGLGLFLFSAVLSLTYATDMRAALWPCSGVILAVGLHGLIWHRRDGRGVSALLAVLPLGIAGLALLMVNWQARLGRFVWLDGVLSGLLRGLLLARTASFRATWDVHTLAGLLAILWPLQWHALTRRLSPTARGLAVAMVGFSIVVAALSGSKAVWVALAISGVSYIVLSARPGRLWAWVQQLWPLGIGLGVLAFWAGLLYAGQIGLLQTHLFTNGSRMAVWLNSLSLARDFAFTGVGFGNFTMAFSSYVVLVQVPFLEHAYSVWLNIWLNQGLLGLLAWIMLSVMAFCGRDQHWRAPGIAALSAVLLYGLLDDPFYGYGGALLPLLLLPMALLAPALAALRKGAPQEAPGAISRRLVAGLAGIAIVGALLVRFSPSLRASWHANRGGMAQLQSELSVYRWPDFAVQDQLRVSSQVDLTLALREYEQALQLDRNNPMANEHLGQIEVARADWDRAQTHLTSAWATDPNRRATRQLLGELCALSGRNEQAAMYWRTLDIKQNQLAIRESWYRYILGSNQMADRFDGALQLIDTH